MTWGLAGWARPVSDKLGSEAGWAGLTGLASRRVAGWAGPEPSLRHIRQVMLRCGKLEAAEQLYLRVIEEYESFAAGQERSFQGRRTMQDAQNNLSDLYHKLVCSAMQLSSGLHAYGQVSTRRLPSACFILCAKLFRMEGIPNLQFVLPAVCCSSLKIASSHLLLFENSCRPWTP